MATTLYLITALIISIPVIAAIVMPRWIKHDENKLHRETYQELRAARGKLIIDEDKYIDGVTAMKMKRLYPRTQL